jgi:succinate dehydrogenase / fumarate reductase cytochrome b subunit
VTLGLDRAFELSSIVPLGAFVILHVGRYASVLFGAESVGARGAPSALVLVLEALLVWLPLAYHCLYGPVVWRRRRAAEGASVTSGLVVLHRLATLPLAFFLVDHFLRFRLPILRGEAYPSDSVQRLVAELSTTRGGVPWVAALGLAGVLAAAFHLGFGLYRVFIRWRMDSLGVRVACVLVGIGVGVAGVATLVRLAAG